MNEQKKLIAPSLMCSDWLQLKKTMRQLEALKVDLIHLDIMDGHFVPNITFGIETVNSIKSITSIPLDIHMMVLNPELFINKFNLDENDIITFHYEAVHSVTPVLDCIANKKVKAGIALKPYTEIKVIENYLDRLHIVLLMMTEPGSYGRPMELGMIKKIKDTKKLINKKKCKTLIEVDGSVSFALAGEMSNAGADIFVAGSSSIFNSNITIEEGSKRLRAILSNTDIYIGNIENPANKKYHLNI